MAIHAILSYTWQYMAARQYMAIRGNTWAIYGYTWLYMAIHGYTWQYMAIHGNTWLYMAIHGNTWLFNMPKGYGSIAHEAKPNGLLTRGP